MDRIKHGLTEHVYRKFKIGWILITIAILLFSISMIWKKNVHSTHNTITKISNKLANNVDVFINGILADVNALPAYTEDNLNCPKNFNAYLHYILINHPQIAGLTIHDKKHHITCSTLSNNKNGLFEENTNKPTILGPLTSPTFNDPVYLIKKNINNYQVEIIVSESMLKSLLSPHANNIQSIDLYNQKNKQDILKIDYSKLQSWLDDKITNPTLAFTEKPLSATAKLHAIEGISVIVTQYHQTLLDNLWHRILLLSADLLVISFFLYFLVKNMLKEHFSLPRLLRKAIKKKQFYPVYQPLYNAKTETYTGAEILLRWKDSDDEIIMPDLFIKEAEVTGLIVPITLQIMDIVFQESKVILNTNPHFHLSFNVSKLHFIDSCFFDKFYQMLNHYAILPKQILLEITERDLLDQDNDIYIKKMNEVREKGFSLAVDDFGTGHASISYLQSFPFNFLKIDKLFIHAIGTKAITESLNDAIIALGKKINVTLIAEGVETIEQVNYLLKNGVQLMQGWYFSKALSIYQLRKLLRGDRK